MNRRLICALLDLCTVYVVGICRSFVFSDTRALDYQEPQLGGVVSAITQDRRIGLDIGNGWSFELSPLG